MNIARNYVDGNINMPPEFYQKYPVVWNGDIELQGIPARLELYLIWGSKETADRGLKYEAEDTMLDDKTALEPENGDLNNESDETTLDPRNSSIMLALPHGKNFEERLLNTLKSQIIVYFIRLNTPEEEASLSNEEHPLLPTCIETMEELRRVISLIYNERKEDMVVDYSTEQVRKRHFSTHLYVPGVKTEGMLSMCAPELLELLKNKCYFMVLVNKKSSATAYDDNSEDIENIDPNTISCE